MADMTQEFFEKYFDIKKQIEASVERGTFKEDFPLCTVDSALSYTAVECMCNAYVRDYTLTIEHVCKVLNLEERHVKNSILPELDYILAPTHSGKFFTTECKDFPFWQQRLLKWKKLFINSNSLKQFLLENVVVETRVSTSSKDEAGEEIVVMEWVSNPVSKELIDGLVDRQITAYRKCNIKQFVLEEKLTRFVEKTTADIRFWQGKQAASMKFEAKRRADKEVSLLNKLTTEDLDLKAHDKEVNDFLERNEHSILILALEGKAPVRLYLFVEG